MLEKIKDFFVRKRWLGFFVNGINPLQISEEVPPLKRHSMEGKFQKFESAEVAKAIVDRAKRQLRWTRFTKETLWPYYAKQMKRGSNQSHFFWIGISKLETYGYITCGVRIRRGKRELFYDITRSFVREATRDIS